MGAVRQVVSGKEMPIADAEEWKHATSYFRSLVGPCMTRDAWPVAHACGDGNQGIAGWYGVVSMRGMPPKGAT